MGASRISLNLSRRAGGRFMMEFDTRRRDPQSYSTGGHVRSNKKKTGIRKFYIYQYKSKKYRVDDQGFLLFPMDWDEDFAEGNAAGVGIAGGLSDKHWKIIRFIRNSFATISKCPTVYVACKENHLGLGDLKELFPAGYLRGVCKLAGVTYREAYLQHGWLEARGRQIDYVYKTKTYTIDKRGFLVDPSEWDENYAIHKAFEMKMPEYLTDRHFRILYFLRDCYLEKTEVPTVHQTCEANHMELEDLERLFPDGYHRGAVKVAGLQVGQTETEPHQQYHSGLTAAEEREKGAIMGNSDFTDKTYPVDSNGFLLDFKQWDRNFAEETARLTEIPYGLTQEHWDVINYIRDTFANTGKCPLVYETCRMCGLTLWELKRLFSTGYQRGACKLAGITYREGYVSQAELPPTAEDLNYISVKKTYKVDVRGFLVDPDDWDEYYAAFRAHDMKICGGKLTDDHWKIIYFLRKSFKMNKQVPTVFETCEANSIDLVELERLFPDGYHRGAVKIAGLRVR
jgi:tRNA 2-thiouridine synthesizing protein E